VSDMIYTRRHVWNHYQGFSLVQCYLCKRTVGLTSEWWRGHQSAHLDLCSGKAA
jgi:hypothetical protein